MDVVIFLFKTYELMTYGRASFEDYYTLRGFPLRLACQLSSGVILTNIHRDQQIVIQGWKV
jgi:hypothetical protein